MCHRHFKIYKRAIFLINQQYKKERGVQAARNAGGHVFVHCSQGVSRSATFVIAYLMWLHDAPYDAMYQAVKAARGVTNPNIGFTCQARLIVTGR